MDRRFLGYYETELRFLRDLGGEFAAAHARFAGRFGLEPDSCADPYVERLLDGFAFLAARVQLKLDAEFPRFTAAPARAGVSGLPGAHAVDGDGPLVPDRPRRRLRPGFRSRAARAWQPARPRRRRPAAPSRPRTRSRCGRSSSPRRRLPHRARCLAGVGLPRPGAKAALRAARCRTPGGPSTQLALDRCRSTSRGGDRLAHRLYEALLGNVASRCGPRRSQPPCRRGASSAAAGRASPTTRRCFPPAPRGFQGYRLLREYFAFPERFLFVELAGCQPAVRRSAASSWSSCCSPAADPTLRRGPSRPSSCALVRHAGLNLFPRRAEPIPSTPHEREYPRSSADRPRPLDFEVYRRREVTGYGRGRARSGRFQPASTAPAIATDLARRRAFYTLRAPPAPGRRRADAERRAATRAAARSSYVGSEVFLALVDGTRGALVRAASTSWTSRPCAPTATCRCSCRRAAVDDRLRRSSRGPAARSRRRRADRPRPSLLTARRAGGDGRSGAWSSHLALNYLAPRRARDGGSGAAGPAAAARASTPRRANRRRGAAGRRRARRCRRQPVVRRLPRPGPITFGRGLEVAVELDERGLRGRGRVRAGRGAGSASSPLRVASTRFTETVLRHERARARSCDGRPGSGERAAGMSQHAPRSLSLPTERRSTSTSSGAAAARVRYPGPAAARPGAAAAEEPVRLGQPPSLAFAPATVAGFEPAATGRRRLERHLRARPVRAATARCRCISPRTPASARATHDDPTLARFCDIFQHRLLALFYRAWADAQPTVQHDRPAADRFRSMSAPWSGSACRRCWTATPCRTGSSCSTPAGSAADAATPSCSERLVQDLFRVPAARRGVRRRLARLPEAAVLPARRRAASLPARPTRSWARASCSASSASGSAGAAGARRLPALLPPAVAAGARRRARAAADLVRLAAGDSS